MIKIDTLNDVRKGIARTQNKKPAPEDSSGPSTITPLKEVRGTGDWIVITGIILITCAALVSTVQSGQQNAKAMAPQIEGSIVRTIFASEYNEVCTGGLQKIQLMEDTRAAQLIAKGHPTRALDVVKWTAEHAAGAANSELFAQIENYRNTSLRDGKHWTAGISKLAALECEAARRGLMKLGG